MSTALQTMTDMMNLTPAQLRAQINQLPTAAFIEGGKALIKFYQSEMKDLKSKRKEYCKGFDTIIDTAKDILKKEDLTSEDRIFFFESMQKANSEKVALLNQLDGKESFAKWALGLSVGGLTFAGLICAYIFKTKD